jgi:2'-5' RNA ligase
MLYCIENQFDEPIKSYHRDLVEKVASEFPKLTWTKGQRLAAHFTLKYKFETERISELEEKIEDFVRTHRPSPVRVGGFDSFDDETVFIKVDASPEARKVFEEFIDALKSLSWMQWRRFDGKDLHFHMSIAEKCNGTAPQALRFLSGKERSFDAYFDNASILRSAEKTPEGMELWELYRRYDMPNAGK